MSLIFLVDQARNNPDVIGSRMMGGGFGGCTINLVKKSVTEEFIKKTTQEYSDQFSNDMKSYVVSVEDGTAQKANQL